MSNSDKKKSTIIKDAVVLLVITLIAGFALGIVHEITLPAIEAQRLKAKTDAYQKVYPEAVNFTQDEALDLLVADSSEVLSSNGYDRVTIDGAIVAVDNAGDKIGYVLTVTTKEGYKGGITVSIGYGLDGVVKGMEVITINETVGFGALAAEDDFKNQFANKKTNKFEYTKVEATTENQIDAISGATITTDAVVNEVNAGICFITESVEAGNDLGGESVE